VANPDLPFKLTAHCTFSPVEISNACVEAQVTHTKLVKNERIALAKYLCIDFSLLQNAL